MKPHPPTTIGKLSKRAKRTDSGDETYSYSEDDSNTGLHQWVRYKVGLHKPATLATDHTKVNKKELIAKFRKIKRGRYALCSVHTSNGDHEYDADEESEGGSKYKTKFRHHVDADPSKSYKKIIGQKETLIPMSIRFNPKMYEKHNNKVITATRHLMLDKGKDDLYDMIKKDNTNWNKSADTCMKELLEKHFWIREGEDRKLLEETSKNLKKWESTDKAKLETDINTNKTNITGNATKIGKLRTDLDAVLNDYGKVLKNANLMQHHISNMEVVVENLTKIVLNIAKQLVDASVINDDKLKIKERPYKSIVYDPYGGISGLHEVNKEHEIPMLNLNNFYVITK